MVIGTDVMDKNPPRLPVLLTREELTEVEALAKEAEESPGIWAATIIEHMLKNARAGALPLVPTDRDEVPPGRRSPLLAPPSRIVPRVGANTNPPLRLYVELTRQELAEVTNLARQANTSPAVLGQIAIRQVLGQLHSGNLVHVTPAMRRTPSPAADAS